MHIGNVLFEFLIVSKKTTPRLETPPGGQEGPYNELQNHLLNSTLTSAFNHSSSNQT